MSIVLTTEHASYQDMGAHSICVKAPTVAFKYNIQFAIAASHPNPVTYLTEYPFGRIFTQGSMPIHTRVDREL